MGPFKRWTTLERSEHRERRWPDGRTERRRRRWRRRRPRECKKEQEGELETRHTEETGCGGWGIGLAGAQGSRRTAGGRRGNRDQFCQNWVHTPGATELGWPTEREPESEEEGSVALLLFISPCSRRKKIYPRVREVFERLRARGSTEQALLNS